MTLYTTNYNLDKYEGIDKPNLRDQYNSAMDKIDNVLKTQEEKQAGDKQELKDRQASDKQELEDKQKQDKNELNQKIDDNKKELDDKIAENQSTTESRTIKLVKTVPYFGEKRMEQNETQYNGLYSFDVPSTFGLSTTQMNDYVLTNVFMRYNTPAEDGERLIPQVNTVYYDEVQQKCYVYYSLTRTKPSIEANLDIPNIFTSLRLSITFENRENVTER